MIERCSVSQFRSIRIRPASIARGLVVDSRAGVGCARARREVPFMLLVPYGWAYYTSTDMSQEYGDDTSFSRPGAGGCA